MPSSMKMNPDNHHFEARYEYPWGGVASDAAPMDIERNQFNQGDGIIIKSGILCAAGYFIYDTINFSLLPFGGIGSGGFFQFGAGSGEYIATIVSVSNVLYALSNKGHAYRFDLPSGRFVLDQTLSGATMQTFSCFQVIAGVIYVFDFNAGASYVYTPGVSYLLNSAFVGGKYCCVIDMYLLTANTNQPTDSPAIKPNRYNWSSPGGYGSWNPATDRTSGFNTLTDVSDQITGMFAMGNVGYVLRTQGLSQLTPNGIGIGPFDTTSLWASLFGVGCTYPDTFSQYGNASVWANDNNIYAFSSGVAPSEITGSAKSAIYADLNAFELDPTVNTIVSGAISNSSVNIMTPDLYYTLLIVYNQVHTTQQSAVTWVYNFRTQAWTRQLIPLQALYNEITGTTITDITYLSAKTIGVGFSSVKLPANYKRIISTLVFSFIASPSTISYTIVLGLYINSDGVQTYLHSASSQVDLVFKSEEFELGRQPSVRGAVIKASGSGTLAVAVNGVPFTPIVLDGTTNLVTYYSSGEFTGEDAQLQISSTTLDGNIVKAYMVGSYAEGEVL